MPRTAHEMDEWPEIRKPWYKKFWRWVLVWMAVVAVLFVAGTVRRVTDLAGSHVEDCEGVVRSIVTEPAAPGSGTGPIRRVNVQVHGQMVEIPMQESEYPHLKVGDTVDLTCRVGRSGTLFVQKWRPKEGSE